MRRASVFVSVLVSALLAASWGVAALALPSTEGGAAPGGAIHLAQAGPNGAVDPQRDCQTVVRCRFTRGGTYRGCISAYTCKACQFVAARCTITGREQVCRRLRCDWGA